VQTRNLITIYAPRWSTRDILVAAWKVDNQNQITITAKRKDGSRYYPQDFQVSGAWIKQWPLEQLTSPQGRFYKVPLDKLLEEA